MDEINIKDFLKYLKGYILALFILLGFAVGGVAVYDMIIKKPVYQAETTAVLAKDTGTGSTASAVTVNDLNAIQKLTSVYGELVKSEKVLNEVNSELNLHSNASAIGKKISVTASTDTATLKIVVKDSDAKTAAAIANKVFEVSSEEMTNIYQISTVSQLTTASIPEKASNNTLVRDLILAVFVVAFGVCGVAFLRFYFDNTIKANDDLEKKFGVNTIGYIPEAEIKSKRMGGELIVEKYPKNEVSESFRTLRTNLLFNTSNRRFKTVLVTSTDDGEGKSFVAANLAVSLAQANKKVLVVDCDLRHGTQYKLFNVPNTKGLSEYLSGDSRMFDKFVCTTKIKNLSVLPSGAYPANPSELLTLKKNKDLIKSLCENYDIVIFDGTEISGLADTVIMSSYADETIVVVKNASITDEELTATKQSLNQVGAKLTGVVMNMTERVSLGRE